MITRLGNLQKLSTVRCHCAYIFFLFLVIYMTFMWIAVIFPNAVDIILMFYVLSTSAKRKASLELLF